MIQDFTSSHLSDDDKVFYLRLAVQERLSLDFTITSEEAGSLLCQFPAGIILQGLRETKRYLEERRSDCVFFTQDETLEIITFFAGVFNNKYKQLHFDIEQPKCMNGSPKYSER